MNDPMNRPNQQPGIAILDLILSMAEASANNADKEAQFNIEHGHLNPTSATVFTDTRSDGVPFNVKPNKDIDGADFESFMRHLHGDYYDDGAHDDGVAGYSPDFVLVDDEDDFDDQDVLYNDNQNVLSVYIENLNINITFDSK